MGGANTVKRRLEKHENSKTDAVVAKGKVTVDQSGYTVFHIEFPTASSASVHDLPRGYQIQNKTIVFRSSGRWKPSTIIRKIAVVRS